MVVFAIIIASKPFAKPFACDHDPLVLIVQNLGGLHSDLTTDTENGRVQFDLGDWGRLAHALCMQEVAVGLEAELERYL